MPVRQSRERDFADCGERGEGRKMARFLIFEYDVVEEAVDQISNAALDLEDQFGAINKSVDQLGTSFKGKAATKFLDGWNRLGKRRTRQMIDELGGDWKELVEIANMVRASDAATAALFVYVED
jgi:uncharacterized protein YukE